MLVDIPKNTINNFDKVKREILNIISFGRPDSEKIETGLYLTYHWNFESCLGVSQSDPEYGKMAYCVIKNYEFGNYGVCDSPKQFKKNTSIIKRFKL